MENILATVYLFSVSIVALIFFAFCVSEWTDKLRKRKGDRAESREEDPVSVPEAAADIVGKSASVFFTPLPPAVMEPLMSDVLEPEEHTFAETEPGIAPEDVETGLSHPYVPDEDDMEYYTDGIMGAPDELSQGLTFEQIGHALDVVEGRRRGETDKYLAGQAFSVMPDDFLNVVCMQADRESMVKKLIDGYLNAPVNVKPVPAAVAGFDISKYI